MARCFSQIRCPLLLIAILLSVPSAPHAAPAYRFHRMWPTLQQPWYFHTPTDVAVDRDGYVYIADAGNYQIQKFTADGHLVTRWAVTLTGYSGIAAGADGFIYVATGAGRIFKFNSNGKPLAAWPPHNEDPLNNPSPGLPSDIAVTPTGRLLVLVNSPYRIQTFTADGRFVAEWPIDIPDGGASRPTSIAVDKNGFVYVADVESGHVLKYTPDGDLAADWTGDIDGVAAFDAPYGLALDGDGNLYISEWGAHSIRILTTEGRQIDRWGGPGYADGRFGSPTGMAVGRNDRLYIADYALHRVQAFTLAGDFMAAWQSRGGNAGQFNYPTGIAGDADGNVYVTDQENDRIQKFGSDGGFILSWGGWGDEEGRFFRPHGVAVADGRVYVADMGNNRIQAFDPDGGFLLQWDGTDSPEGRFAAPSDVAVDADGNVYVADWDNHFVRKFSADGEPLTAWGGSGSGDGQFLNPIGVAVYGENVYVTDKDNGRIQVFDLDGTYRSQWASAFEPGGGSFSYGIAADRDGRIYVPDRANHAVQVFTADGELVEIVGRLGTDPGQSNGPSDAWIAPDGRLYVTDAFNHRVQVFKPAEPSTQISKAVIVAGGGPFPGNALWNATRACANFAYRALTHQGFTKETIHYLSPETDLDLDGNGQADDIDGDLSLDAIRHALSAWVLQNPIPDRLILYLVDHGGADRFRLNGTDALSASQLADLIARLDMEVIAVYDACKSGGFIPLLSAGPGRRIIAASTSPDEEAFFIGQGTVSFSNYFWTHIFNGASLGDAFDRAASAIETLTARQHPLLESDGDGIGGDWGSPDAEAVRDVWIGNGNPQPGDAPAIEDADALIRGPATAVLEAAVSDADGVARVWGVVAPPGFTPGPEDIPILSLPTVDLAPEPDAPDRYRGAWSGFDSDGVWRVYFHAQDRRGNIAVQSEPVEIVIGDPPRRKAVILAGDSLLYDDAIREDVLIARDALRFQGYSDDDIYLMSPEPYGTDHDATPTLNNLTFALEEWAADNARDLLLWIIGDGAPGAVRLNDAETLAPEILAALLADARSAVTGGTIVLLDADFAGGFLPALAAIENPSIVMASTPVDETARRDISFSGFFWKGIRDGATVGQAFSAASEALGVFSTAYLDRAPQLDDNGNGIGNDIADGATAAETTIGLGIRLGVGVKLSTGGETDALISPTRTLTDGDTDAVLWIDRVISDSEIARVHVVVVPPGADAEPMETDLAPSGDGRYEATVDGFTRFGDYHATVYVTDAAGDAFRHGATTIRQTGGPDRFEDDDAPGTATFIVPNDAPGLHGFHDETDVDWVRFHAENDAVLTLEAADPDDPETLCEDVLSLYGPDGDTLLNETETGELTWQFDETGRYLAKIAPGPASPASCPAYRLRLYPPTAVFPGYLKGRVTDRLSGEPISGAEIATNLGAVFRSLPDGWFRVVQPPARNVRVEASAGGYQTETAADVTILEGGATVRNFALAPVDTQPVAAIDFPTPDTEIAVGETVLFQGSSQNGNAPFTFNWDFGNGTGSNVEDPADIVFPEPGEYEVTFTVTDGNGDASSASVILSVVEGEGPAVPSDTPALALPGDGQTNVKLPFEFRIETPTDMAFVHTATQWQISGADFGDAGAMMLDRTLDAHRTELTLPTGLLPPDTRCVWRVRLLDAAGPATDWSTVSAFTTAPDGPNDAPDGTAVEGGDDTDVAYAETVYPDRIFQDGDGTREMPEGYVRIRATTDAAGAPARVVVRYDAPIPDDAVWHDYDPIQDAWQMYADHAAIGGDRKSVTIEIMDGGFGDIDGVANGVIFHVSGFWTAREIAPPPEAPSGSAGGGGCFIRTAGR